MARIALMEPVWSPMCKTSGGDQEKSVWSPLPQYSYSHILVYSSPLERRFEEWLQSLDRSYGLRNLEDVIAAAESEHLDFVESIEMPANNLSVLFQKRKA